MVLDGDASNPEGLVRLLFGLGIEGEPKPLIEFFGGIDTVTCPVDDPSPLTRINDLVSIPEKKIDLFKEISAEYYLQKEKTTLLQAGKIESYVGVKYDVTHEKQMEKQLIQTQKMESLGILAGGIAHDFNNALHAILGYSELLRSTIPDNQAAQESLEQILLAGNRAKSLVKQILTFSRQGKHELELLQMVVSLIP